MSPNKDEAVLVMLVSRNVLHVVYYYSYHLLADQISCRSYVGSVYRMQALLENTMAWNERIRARVNGAYHT